MRMRIPSVLIFVLSCALSGENVRAQVPCNCSQVVYSGAPIIQGGPWIQPVATGEVIAGGVIGQPMVMPASFNQPVMSEPMVIGAEAPLVASQPILSGSITPTSVVSGEFSAPVVVGEGIVTGSLNGGFAAAPILGAPVAGPVVNVMETNQILPYSYYASATPPARHYVEFGATDQFPFYGRPYGNPGDRWSWYYMGGGERRYLANYYYPILQ